MIRVEIPAALAHMARVERRFELELPEGPVTPRAIVDALEARHPVLRGSIREPASGERRPYLRYFACQQDWSHAPQDRALPEAVATGAEPFIILGAISGG